MTNKSQLALLVEELRSLINVERSRKFHDNVHEVYEDVLGRLLSGDLSQSQNALDELMILASDYGDSSILEKVFQAGGNINARNEFEQTPAHIFAMDGDLSCLMLVTKLGADLTAIDDEEKTPAHWTVTNPNVDCLAFLAEQGADLEVHDQDGYTVAHLAAKTDRNNSVLALETLAKHKVDFEAKDKRGNTPLLVAMSSINIEAVKFLLEFGVNYNVKNGRRQTAMNIAYLSGNPEIIELLLDLNDKR